MECIDLHSGVGHFRKWNSVDYDSMGRSDVNETADRLI